MNFDLENKTVFNKAPLFKQIWSVVLFIDFLDTVQIAFIIPVLDGFAFVVDFLSFGQGDFQFGLSLFVDEQF